MNTGMGKTVFLCDDSPDGILTGIYEAYESRLGHGNLCLEIENNVNYELFCEYRRVDIDGEKAEKVARTIRRRLGEEAWHHIYHAMLSEKSEKAEAVYRTVVLGLSGNAGNAGISVRFMENLKNPFIFQVFSLSRAVGYEAHRYLGFLRFREMQEGILFSEISPQGQILPLIGDHFADRYPLEHFLIYDRQHDTFLMHPAGKSWVLLEGMEFQRENLTESEGEREFAHLWQRFVTTIAIPERKNPKLQRQMLPLKFRKYMTEKF